MPIGVYPKRVITTFDRDVIRRNWKAINETPLKKAGLLIRRIAINSIRKRKNKNKPAPAGSPPYSHAAGHPIRLIYSVPEGINRVLVGPVGFGASTPVPAIHEFGKIVSRKIRVGPRRQQTGKWKQQFARRSVKYPARPVMGPALDKGAPALPFMWRGSIRE